MNSYIFYCVPTQGTRGNSVKTPNGERFRIRIECIKDCDSEEALQKAKPKEGEVVLNAIDEETFK